MSQINKDLQTCKWIIKKRYTLILATCLLGVAIASFINFITPPRYEAVASLRIKPSEEVPLFFASMTGGSQLSIKQTMANYAALLKSRTVVQEAINQVYKDQKFSPRYEQIISNITVKPAKEADILYIVVQSTSPQEAQLLANTLSETLIALLAKEQGAVKEFIGQRLKDAKQELDRAERALEDYKREQKMIGADMQSRAMAEKLASLDRMLAENTVNLAIAQAKLNNAERQLAGQKPTIVADNAMIQQYKSKLADMEVELAGLLPKHADSHPKVVALRASITETRSKLNAEVARVLNAEAASGNPITQALMQEKIMAEADIAAATAQKRAISTMLANSEKDMASLPAKEQGMTRLIREAQVAQEIYMMLDRRYEEARINEVLHPKDVRVLDAAIVPEFPIQSRSNHVLLVGMMVGLLLGTAIAFLLEYSKRPVLNDQEAKELLGLPVLGIIPDFSTAVDLPQGTWGNKVRKLFTR